MAGKPLQQVLVVIPDGPEEANGFPGHASVTSFNIPAEKRSEFLDDVRKLAGRWGNGAVRAAAGGTAVSVPTSVKCRATRSYDGHKGGLPSDEIQEIADEFHGNLDPETGDDPNECVFIFQTEDTARAFIQKSKTIRGVRCWIDD